MRARNAPTASLRLWRGWWGEEPPFHCPVYVLTHSDRPSMEHQLELVTWMQAERDAVDAAMHEILRIPFDGLCEFGAEARIAARRAAISSN